MPVIGGRIHSLSERLSFRDLWCIIANELREASDGRRPRALRDSGQGH
jgi:hypothetical protein